MGVLKSVHVVCVVLSFAGFFIRGIWMLAESKQLQKRWVKMAPHLVDTVLLVSAVFLAIQMHMSPFEQPWLMAKIVALLVYIGLGMIALRHGRSKRTRLLAWLLGLVTMGYIVSVAFSKSVYGLFVFL